MKSRESGLTLVELLVAMTVLLIVVACALAMYDATVASFKKSEKAAEQQQGTRIAFDRISADLQMAGFNFNPDGDPSRPDEQIEAAYDTAIVLRADFDRQAQGGRSQQTSRYRPGSGAASPRWSCRPPGRPA